MDMMKHFLVNVRYSFFGLFVLESMKRTHNKFLNFSVSAGKVRLVKIDEVQQVFLSLLLKTEH